MSCFDSLHRYPLCDKCCRESISSVTMWNIVNQLGEYEFLCGAVKTGNLL